MRTKVNTPPLVVILGPTASGKTSLGIKLAQKFEGEIISADSRQIYKFGRIGTSQPAGQWQKKSHNFVAQKITHYLVDLLEPTANFSLEKFQSLANKLISEINSRHHLPMLVGGTGLYISSLIESYTLPQGEPNFKIRHELTRLSTADLNNKLKKLDRKTYLKIDHFNRVRLIRALEYNLTTGQSISINQKKSLRGNTLIIGLRLSKDALIKNINRRTKSMVKNGLIKETEYLLKNYPESILLKTIGFNEVAKNLSSHNTKAELIQLINTHTWQYAKRQLTWFKKTPNIHWVDNYTEAKKLVTGFLKSN